ncbi:hypothetical protein GT755_26000 [Herbidospora sp. NEAU-GS84]|uniref:Uncharacterized protein n=1 Tax=Herbidospora solisilvae TaxID=2696284 RepID=A0A7C9JHS8_9ACTN|nr:MULTISPECIES: DUF6232 family protein [Herbidospora]NAS25123.1 hypothetical protein [Herbidospora solisilvae]
MAKKKVGEIRISKRIVRIGHEVYPLANISRVQTLRIVYKGRLSTFHPLGQLVVVAALAAAAAFVAEEVFPEAREYLPVALAVAGVCGGLLAIQFLYRLIFRRNRYALTIETAGTQYTALWGTDLEEIRRIEGLVVAAIEDPPPTERSYTFNSPVYVGNTFGRDTFNVSGSGRATVNN